MMNAESLKALARKRAQEWVEPPYDRQTQARVTELLAEDGELLVESFYTELEFGTGGLRGLMGDGTNRMNRYTVGQATQGLAQYILQADPTAPSVAIAHDSRNGSTEFAQVAAEVLAANGIEVHLFAELRPTPQLSFTVRHLGCTAGIVITASHNPKEYNGYKVYWNDGGQIVPPHDSAIIAEVRAVAGPNEVKWGDVDSSRRIYRLEASDDQPYVDSVLNLRLDDSLKNQGSDLKIVYTPLHGTGAVSVIPTLRAAGFREVHVVESQRVPDGNFPTVHSPNPEEGAALSAAIDLANQVGAQLVLGTDPDSDRVGIAVPDPSQSNGWRLLNGNETGSLLVDYVVQGMKKTGTLDPSFDFIAKTIVTSDLMSEIGRSEGMRIHETLTGFKWIAAIIREYEGRGRFIVGGEESYGYMIGDAVRDKDAVAASCMICEMAHVAARSGKNLLDQLQIIHERHGAFKEALVSQTKHGREGKQAIADQMESLRTQPPQEIGGEIITELRDYRSQMTKHVLSGETKNIDLPSSNVIQIVTAEQSIVTARPSGTEPKIKFYFSVRMHRKDWDAYGGYAGAMSELEARIDRLKKAMGV